MSMQIFMRQVSTLPCAAAPWRRRRQANRSSGNWLQGLLNLTAARLLLCGMVLWRAQAQGQPPSGEPAADNGSNKVLIILVDYSGSMKALEDRNQALVTHLVRLAALS